VPRKVATFAVSLNEEPAAEIEHTRAFLRRRVDGLILTAGADEQSYLQLAIDRGTAVCSSTVNLPGYAPIPSRSTTSARPQRQWGTLPTSGTVASRTLGTAHEFRRHENARTVTFAPWRRVVCPSTKA
jgi:hypothetical protein